MKEEKIEKGQPFLNEEESNVLLDSLLFQGIRKEELTVLLPCLKTRKVRYTKGEMIFSMGEKITYTGMILSGQAHIEWYDFYGRRHIVNAILPGDIFGENYAAAEGVIPNVNVQVDEESVVLLFDLASLLHMCGKACIFHSRLIDNLVSFMARRNIALREKITYVTQPSLKDKILSYLTAESYRQHSLYFDIPFDRQQLADFLDSDRSALSSELSKLRKEGLIDFEKNHFHLLAKKEMD